MRAMIIAAIAAARTVSQRGLTSSPITSRFEAISGELQVAEVREGRSEVVQMWGRPESVREEFRQRRSI